jgi:hypothetical protein
LYQAVLGDVHARDLAGHRPRFVLIAAGAARELVGASVDGRPLQRLTNPTTVTQQPAIRLFSPTEETVDEKRPKDCLDPA